MNRFLFVLFLALGGCATGLHDVQVDGTLEVTGASTLTGATTQTGALTVAGATTLSSTLAVTGASTLTGALGVTGATTLTGDLTTNGAIIANKVYETFAEGAAGKGITLMEYDNTAWSGTVGAHNYLYTGGGNIFVMSAMGDNQAQAPVMAAEGLDIAGDQADNEGFEIWTGANGGSGRPFIIGTDPAFYFHFGVDIDDVSGTDVFICGFRKLEIHNADSRAYDTYFGLGSDSEANPMALEVIEELNGAAGNTEDTTQTLADGIAYEGIVLVSAAGVATLTHDAATPGTQAAPTATSAFTFDDGDMVIPFCSYLQANATQTAGFNITLWDVGPQ